MSASSVAPLTWPSGVMEISSGAIPGSKNQGTFSALAGVRGGVFTSAEPETGAGEGEDGPGAEPEVRRGGSGGRVVPLEPPGVGGDVGANVPGSSPPSKRRILSLRTAERSRLAGSSDGAGAGRGRGGEPNAFGPDDATADTEGMAEGECAPALVLRRPAIYEYNGERVVDSADEADRPRRLGHAVVVLAGGTDETLPLVPAACAQDVLPATGTDACSPAGAPLVPFGPSNPGAGGSGPASTGPSGTMTPGPKYMNPEPGTESERGTVTGGTAREGAGDGL